MLVFVCTTRPPRYVRPGVYVAMLGYGWPRDMLVYTAKTPLGYVATPSQAHPYTNHHQPTHEARSTNNSGIICLSVFPRLLYSY